MPFKTFESVQEILDVAPHITHSPRLAFSCVVGCSHTAALHCWHSAFSVLLQQAAIHIRTPDLHQLNLQATGQQSDKSSLHTIARAASKLRRWCTASKHKSGKRKSWLRFQLSFWREINDPGLGVDFTISPFDLHPAYDKAVFFLFLFLPLSILQRL